MNELPASLRSEVIQHTHGDIINKINFLRGKDPDILWAILPILRPLKLLPNDILYTQSEHADEIYFIKRGKIKLYVDINMNDPNIEESQNLPFIAYVEGSYFGDSDIFFADESKGRDGTAIADSEAHLLVLTKRDIF